MRLKIFSKYFSLTFCSLLRFRFFIVLSIKRRGRGVDFSRGKYVKWENFQILINNVSRRVIFFEIFFFRLSFPPPLHFSSLIRCGRGGMGQKRLENRENFRILIISRNIFPPLPSFYLLIFSSLHWFCIEGEEGELFFLNEKIFRF